MMSIAVTGLDEVRQELRDFSERRLKAAVATALTRTAVQVVAAVRGEMSRVFERPTPYTVRQLNYVPATAERLAAAVGFNVVAVTDEFGAVIRYRDLGAGETPAGKYLQPQIEGGPRRMKRLEVALQAAGALPAGMMVVPGQGARLDAFGNVSRGQVVQVLSQLRIQLVSGSSRNAANDRRAISAQRRAGGRFFVMPPGGKAQPGVYQRELIGRNVTPVFIFVKATQYKRRFDFYGMSQRLVDAQLSVQMDRAITESARRLAARRAP